MGAFFLIFYLFLDKELASNAESQICLIFTVLFAKRMIGINMAADVTAAPNKNIVCKDMAGSFAVIIIKLIIS